MADKLLDGLAPLDTRDAHSVGRWLGFDIECDEEVADLAGSGDFGVIAESLLVRFLRATLQTEPAVLLLEDIHWADDDSLDTICHLVEHLDDLPLLVVAASRPTLDQRRPDWAAGPGTSRRIDLQPLSDADARGLVAEILRLVDDVPDALVDLAVAHSDGNPFYVEELVKTLLEEGVVQVASDGPWAVDLSRLRGVTVPPTLSGVLQARLDALPADERAALQHASVVGRTFWDDAIATLLSGNGGPDPATSAQRSTACAGASWCGGTSTRASRTARSTGSSTPSCATPPTRPCYSATGERSTPPPRHGWSCEPVSGSTSTLRPSPSISRSAASTPGRR